MNRHSSLLALSLGVLVASSACGGSNSTTTSQMATTNVTLSDPATCVGPNGPYAHVYVTVNDVQISAANGSFIDLTPNLAKSPVQVDLLGVANNECLLATLGSTTELQPGSYNQIRLILEDNSSGSLVANNQCGATAANCVVLSSGGPPVPLQLTSESQTGIKIPSGQIAGGQFVVAAGQTKDLNIDFNTCSSIVAEGNGDFRLKPVLHAGEVGLTSDSINGTVVDKATTQPIVGGNVMVALEQKDSTGVDRVIMATDADSSGHFVFCPVPAGTYDVVAVGISGTNTAYAATVTTGVAVGTAMGNVPLIAETGASTAPATLTGSVSSTTGSAATLADVSLSALASATLSSGTLTYTMPLVQQMAATASLATAPGATCAANTDCASYSLSVPAAPATVGAFAATGTSYTPGTGAVTYNVEADAELPSSGGTPDCSPATLTTTTALTVSAGVTTQVAVLAFTGCD